jgi:hypothetical protein
MSQLACRYALIQLVPYAETGEFANIGVLLVCPETGFLGFKLETQKHKRYTSFFSGLTASLYRDAMKAISAELKRLQQALSHATPETLLNSFTAAIHPREAIIQFSPVRGRLIQDPAKALQQLFEHYVDFGFLRQQSPEEQLEQRIQAVLSNFELIAPFKDGKIGSEQLYVPLPLIQSINNKPNKAIKPLYLGQDSLNKLYAHGEYWAGRLERLRKVLGWEGKLLFTVDGISSNSMFKQNQNEIMQKLRDLSAEVIEAADVKRLQAFCVNP